MLQLSLTTVKEAYKYTQIMKRPKTVYLEVSTVFFSQNEMIITHKMPASAEQSPFICLSTHCIRESSSNKRTQNI